jgi:restriction system protein
MNKAGLWDATRRGFFRISQRGKDVLNKKPDEINTKFLERYPEFIEFRARRREAQQQDSETVLDSRQTPAELLESAYQKLQSLNP